MANKIILAGTKVAKPHFSHEIFGEKFYEVYIASKRNSGVKDVLPCIIPETLLNEVEENERLTFYGTVRTHNKFVGDVRKLIINVFVDSVGEYTEDMNDMTMECFLCKEAVYRETPMGREIADLLVANQRERTCKSDYIPCIAWGRNARRVSVMEVGTKLSVIGRLQSREYLKTLEDGSQEVRTAYELSASRIDVLDSEVVSE